MLEVVDELRERIANGEITSLAIVAEALRCGPPRVVIRGRFNSDPHRALAALCVAETRLMVMAQAISAEFQEL